MSRPKARNRRAPPPIGAQLELTVLFDPPDSAPLGTPGPRDSASPATPGVPDNASPPPPPLDCRDDYEPPTRDRETATTDDAQPNDAIPSPPLQGVPPGLMPAAAFAALVGRTLRTLRDWDRAGVTRPVVIRHRRYYREADVAALLTQGDGRRRGPRAGSPIKYLCPDWDNDT